MILLTYMDNLPNQENPLRPQEPTNILQTNSSSKNRIFKNPFLWGGLIVLVFILIVLIYFKSWFPFHQQKIEPVPTGTSTITTTTPNPTLTATTGAVLNSVEFIPREQMASYSFDDTTQEGYTITTTYQFFKVGHFISGKYVGGNLLLALISSDGGPCKSAHCGEPNRFRYAKVGNHITLLEKVSTPISRYPGATDLEPVNDALVKRPFEKMSLVFDGIDSSSTIVILEYPKTLALNNRAVVYGPGEQDGTLDKAQLNLSFHDPVMGEVWTTKPELSAQKSFYDDCKQVDPKSHGEFDDCIGLSDYVRNSFYVFRPDGTFLTYVYEPDFKTDNITWNNGTVVDTYDYVTREGCGWVGVNSISVVSSSLVSNNDLEIIGKIGTTGDPIHDLKDKNHQLYTEFYQNYKSHFPAWYNNTTGNTNKESNVSPLSYQDFIKATPIFFWRDPFGRLIRFNNTQFIVPNECEPIIYLYPPKQENVEVKLGSNITITNSWPVYDNGWYVSASPDGRITNILSGKVSPYLFWEGHSYILPPQNNGFVVAKEDIQNFLNTTLPKLGLNEKETKDFMRAWVPQLSEAPYYFITFIDQTTINNVAPLEITPKPDTLLRVLMDFKALDKPIQVSPLQLPPTPIREGFTVVEWGGLKR